MITLAPNNSVRNAFLVCVVASWLAISGCQMKPGLEGKWEGEFPTEKNFACTLTFSKTTMTMDTYMDGLHLRTTSTYSMSGDKGTYQIYNVERVGELTPNWKKDQQLVDAMLSLYERDKQEFTVHFVDSNTIQTNGLRSNATWKRIK